MEGKSALYGKVVHALKKAEPEQAQQIQQDEQAHLLADLHTQLAQEQQRSRDLTAKLETAHLHLADLTAKWHTANVQIADLQSRNLHNSRLHHLHRANRRAKLHLSIRHGQSIMPARAKRSGSAIPRF